MTLRFEEQVIAIADALAGCGIEFAIGGAIAFGYAAEPRGTIDIDINVFMGPDNAAPTLECLSAMGLPFDFEQGEAEARSSGQLRINWKGTFIDLFFAYAEFHESCHERVRRVPFGGITVPILSAEDIVIFKALFNRPKDWLDIEQVVRTQGPNLDATYVLHWMDDLVGPADLSRERLARLLADLSGG